MKNTTLVLGAVAYDPKVVTIWDGFQMYFRGARSSFDYVLYTNYERQVKAHFAGHIHVAWNRRWPGCRPSALRGSLGGAPKQSPCAIRTVT